MSARAGRPLQRRARHAPAVVIPCAGIRTAISTARSGSSTSNSTRVRRPTRPSSPAARPSASDFVVARRAGELAELASASGRRSARCSLSFATPATERRRHQLRPGDGRLQPESSGRLAEIAVCGRYRYVGGKEDLLDQVADELYAEFAVATRAGDWWQTLARIAHAGRSALLAHPWTVPLFSRPAAGPHAAAAGRSVIDALRDAGFSEPETNELHEQLTHMVLALVAAELHGRRNRAAFERGLDLLRAGLDARRPHPGRSRRSAAERGTKRS
jgi:hypothetical protein